MRSLPSAITQLPKSEIREVMERARGDPDVLHLEVGEPDFPTPSHIVEAAHRALDRGETRYAPNAGLGPLREAIARRHSQVLGRQLSPSDVIVTPGSVWAGASALMALCEPGDQVLFPDPAWPNFRLALLSRGVEVIPYELPAAQGFVPDPNALAGLVTPRSKALVVNSPSNPTGAVFPREVVEGLVEFATAHDLWLLSDEIYAELVYDGEHVPAAQFDTENRVLTLGGFSKSHAMTGWRVGYVVVPPPGHEAVLKLQEPFVSCACTVSQHAALAACDGPQDCVAAMREEYRERRDLVLSLLGRAGLATYVPNGAFYVLADIADAALHAREFAFRLLDEERVAVAPGTAFGTVSRGSVRVSFAASRQVLGEAVGRLCRFVDRRRHRG